ncbi:MULTISPECIES: polyprenyl diphosphate synthase [Candidatus Ichthyocystis]|uniref:Isoprenyl transferase n=1 Tax=Candidatus Ichthyocystis hellenicum TaxID=1561003 RepID=A0A0S4M1S7_9BURK|nr:MULTISPECIES: polyprenyl diphosphate synthase [Ichthyocystis]CUT16975.1 Undecaprenyl pyrophosphate synthase [Candidatus Ichthyocystis hellenicum]
MSQSSLVGTIPRHIAIVMDGNGRWAEQRLLSRLSGHRRGVDAAECVVRSCLDYGVPCLTLFAFSTENWRRPDQEIESLFSLLVSAVRRQVDFLKQQGVRLSFIGDRGSLTPFAGLLDELSRAEKETQNNDRLFLNVALNYGGRWDIVQAFRSFVADNPFLSPCDVSSERLRPYFCLSHLPEPDLFIRTSGEHRISNFFLWQLAYTEFYFTPIFWPDFDEQAFADAIDVFQRRNRRFGSVGTALNN